jgi:predicted Rossmann fold flavoprotein
MAAIFAATKGADTVLLERTSDGGRKILISGGGRCNILPALLDESRFVTDSSPHTLRNIVRSWPLAEQIAFFERELRLPLVEEQESGKLFPSSQRARDVRDGLLDLAASRGVRFQPNAAVTGASPTTTNGGWRVMLDSGTPVEADALIMATGGLSVPQTGSDGLGLRIVEQLGHTVHPTYAALTPITAEPAPFGHLAGVSLRVTITAHDGARTATATGGMLCTHRGYSGPAVLDVSHVVVRSGPDSPARLRVRWAGLDDGDWEGALRPQGARTVTRALRDRLPERLALALLGVAGVDAGRAVAQLRREERRRLLDLLERGALPWTGHAGYTKAEVTGGGVSLAEIDPRTMESRRHPGLFLCGELLDAFGPIGGYNFVWAWVTGRAAGLGAAGKGVAGR